MASITESEIADAINHCIDAVFAKPAFTASVASIDWDVISLIMSAFVAGYLNAKYLPKDCDGVGRATVIMSELSYTTPLTKYFVAVPPSSYTAAMNFEHLIINVPRYVYLRQTKANKSECCISRVPLWAVEFECPTDTQDHKDVAMFRQYKMSNHRAFWNQTPHWVQTHYRKICKTTKL